MRVHMVYIRPDKRSFSFSVVWSDVQGTLRPEGDEVDIAFPLDAQGKGPEELWDAYVCAIRLELEKTACARAARLAITNAEYCAAIGDWVGDIVII